MTTAQRVAEVTPDKIRQYRTTASSCACPARRYRSGDCKHMKALQKAAALVEASRAAQEEHANDTVATYFPSSGGKPDGYLPW